MTAANKVVVIKAVEGKIAEREVVEKPLPEAVREVASRALSEWNPESSDFTVIRGKYELRYKLPISPDLYDVLEELNLEKQTEPGEDDNYLVVYLPVYTISYVNEWTESTYHDKAVYIVAPYLDEESAKQLEEYAIETTKEPKKLSTTPELQLTEEQLQRLEEGLQEAEAIEQEEKPKKRSRKRSRRKKQEK